MPPHNPSMESSATRCAARGIRWPPERTDAQCIQECIKSGSSYALVAGTKVYTLAAKPETIAPFAGKHVHIEGDVKGAIITVTSIAEAMPKGMKM